MSSRETTRLIVAVALLGLVLLPLVGIMAGNYPVARYTEFPPKTQYVEHADFSWVAFVVVALLIVIVLLPFDIHVRRSRVDVRPRKASRYRFPWWGWVGAVAGILAWILAWTRFGWFGPLQRFTFSPLWFSYIVVVNALTFARTGHCMLKDRPRYVLSLFVLSAVFWWYFEYLNRFVQNWYYEGAAGLTPWQYFIFATLPFSTVLPAVLGTYEFLDSLPRAGAGLDKYFWIRTSDSKVFPATVLTLSCAGLAAIGIWPDYLFPLLWVSPLLIITSIQALMGRETIFAGIRRGKWRRLYLLAMSALICGFFWEMWNSLSLARWIYAVPLVGRFKVFEMPILGFAGYLPFGLECAVVASFGDREATAKDSTEDPLPGGSRKAAIGLAAIVLAAAIWLPLLHVFCEQNVDNYLRDSGLSPKAKAIAARHLELWTNPSLRAREIEKMRQSNAEWDFMGRTFFALSLANIALREPGEKVRCLQIMDFIIDETVRLEEENGIYYFLMDYARHGQFQSKARRSLFQDGEIALMIAARQLVEENPDYKYELRKRIKTMVKYMQESPVLSGESYPDECWTFCNTVALAAIRIGGIFERRDYSEFLDDWITLAKEKLIDRETGMLVSSYTFDGAHCDGPEGSSIWMVAHCLQIIDREFAEDQYLRARDHLGRSVLGFGYAREWPKTWTGPADIDSGPIVPILEMSAGASGMAFIGASVFGDRAYLSRLLTSLHYGGFPIERKGRLKYCASNPVGDAVLLYSMVQGPLWERVLSRSRGGE